MKNDNPFYFGLGIVFGMAVGGIFMYGMMIDQNVKLKDEAIRIGVAELVTIPNTNHPSFPPTFEFRWKK